MKEKLLQFLQDTKTNKTAMLHSYLYNQNVPRTIAAVNLHNIEDTNIIMMIAMNVVDRSSRNISDTIATTLRDRLPDLYSIEVDDNYV